MGWDSWDGGGAGGGGSISEVTSADGSIAVVDPLGPDTDLSAQAAIQAALKAYQAILGPVDYQASLSGAYTIVDPSTTGISWSYHILTGNVTYTAPATSTLGFVKEGWMYIQQDATGSRTATWPANIIGSAPSIESAAGDVTLVKWETVDSVNYLFTVIGGGAQPGPPAPPASAFGATNLLNYGAEKFETMSAAQASAWVGIGCTYLSMESGRISPQMGGTNIWSAGAGASSVQNAIISNTSVAKVHAAGGKCFLEGKFDSGGTLGPALLGSWSDTGVGKRWYPGQLATATTTITTSATGTITVASTTGFAASGSFFVQTAVGVAPVTVTYTGLGGGGLTFTGCSVASGSLVITSGTTLVAPGTIRLSMQCLAGAAAQMGFDGLIFDNEPYYAEGQNPSFHTTLSSSLSTGGPITSLPINTPTGSVQSGSQIILSTPAGQTQTFFATGAATSSAVPVTSLTPTFAFPATTTTVVSGRPGWAWDASAPLNATQATVNASAQARGQDFMQWVADAWTAYATASNPTPQILAIDTIGFSATVLNAGTPFTANTQGSLDEAVIYAVDGGTVYQSSTFQPFWAGTLAASSAGMPSAIMFGTEIIYRGPAGIGCPFPPSWSSTQGKAACLDMTLAYMQNTTLSALSQQASAAAWAAMQNKVFAIPGLWIDGDGSGGFQGFPDNATDVNMLLGSGAVGKMPAWTNPNMPVWLFQAANGTLYQPYPASGSSVGFNYKTGSRGGSTTPGANYSNTDYTPAMTNVLTKYTVDSTAPTVGSFSPASGGSHAHGALTVTGVVTPGADGNPIASVAYSVNGGAVQGAVMTLDLLSGSFTAGWVWQMNFSAPLTLAVGANSVVFTVTTVSGLVTTSTWTQVGT